MNVVVVVAHPSEESLTKAAAAAVLRGLERGEHDVTVIDLYRDDFTPAMTADERAAYHTSQPLIDDQTSAHAALVKQAEMLVFVYPTWWSGLPAVLHGWLERVFVPGVAITFDEHTHEAQPALTNVRRIVGVSTYGSPSVLVKLLSDAGRRIITRAIRMSCGRKTSTTWLALYHVHQSDASVRKAFLERIEETMARAS